MGQGRVEAKIREGLASGVPPGQTPPHMSSSAGIRLLSTDFDGTIHEDFAEPRIPLALQARIADFQSRGGIWVINTGREMASLMESLGRGHVTVQPDYLILVEREIYRRDHGRYLPVEPWNTRCTEDHSAVFRSVDQGITQLMEGLAMRHDATFYQDAFSPLCAIARSNPQMDAIQSELEAFCSAVSGLTVVRNDVYVRLSHVGYSKGTALSELGRILGIGPEGRMAAGDHLNDLPMLQRVHAHRLVAPSNALPAVRDQVLREGGWVASKPAGHGVLEALELWGI